MRQQLADGDARTPLSAKPDMHPGGKHRHDRKDSRAKNHIGSAAADRGPTTPAHAGRHACTQTDADAGATVKHVRKGGDSVRRRLADRDAHMPLSAKADMHPGGNKVNRVHIAMGRLTSLPPCFGGHQPPWRHYAGARRHACIQADADAGAAVKNAWVHGDSVRERLADGDAHTHLSTQAHMHPGGKQSQQGSPRRGRLTSRSRSFVCHRRPWCNCARACRHACTQTDADATAAFKHAWWRHLGAPTRQRRHAHAPQYPSRHGPQRKLKSTWLAAIWDTHMPTALLP